MPSLKDIRKRIGSVKNTQKITRAMKLVAAAKLRRSQDAIIAQRPYAQELAAVISDLAARTSRDAHPLLQEREGKRALVIALSSDRGLAGAYNANIIRAAEGFVRDHSGDYEDIQLWLIGRKVGDYFNRRKGPIFERQLAPTSKDAQQLSREVTNTVKEAFLEGKFDRVFVIYNEFKSAITQVVRTEQLLPVVPAELDSDDANPSDFTYEPSKAELLDHLLPLYVSVQLFRSFLESIASEFGARMSAMDNATRNADDMIGKLTLQYNRARQAAITKELLEIISGAESLKG